MRLRPLPEETAAQLPVWAFSARSSWEPSSTVSDSTWHANARQASDIVGPTPDSAQQICLSRHAGNIPGIVDKRAPAVSSDPHET